MIYLAYLKQTSLKIIFVITLISILTTPSTLLAAETNQATQLTKEPLNLTPQKYANLWSSHDQTFSYDYFKNILLNYSIENLLESHYPLSVYLIPAMGDYSHPDNYIFSLLGNSWLWNKYHYNGMNINDGFFTGRTLHKIPAYSKDVKINAIDGELNMFGVHQERVLYIKGNLNYLGGSIPMYKLFKDPYSLQSPQLRDRPPPDERRRSIFNIELYKKEVFLFGSPEHALWVDGWFNVNTRKYLDFDENGDHTEHQESYIQSSFLLELEKTDGTRPYGLLFTYLNRDQLYSEFYYHPQETANLHHLATTFYYKSLWDKLRHQHGVNFAYKRIKKNNENFSRNVFDVTAEGLYPYYPSVNVFEISQYSKVAYDFDAYQPKFLSLSSHLNNSLLIVNPITEKYKNAVYFKSPKDTLSLYQTDWEAKSFSYLLLENEIVLDINKRDQEGFSVDGSVGLDIDGFVIGNNENIVRFSPSFNVGMNIMKMPRHPLAQNLRIEIGRKNVPFSSEYALFLSDEYQSGTNRVWDDKNNNLAVDDGELGGLHSTTGGKSREIDPNFKQPHYYYLDIPYNLAISEEWNFHILAHYRIFKEQAWVKLKKQDGTTTTTTNGKPVYQPNNGEKNYVVYNLPKDKFPSNGRNWFSDSPFYMGITLGFSGEGDRYFFDLSFAAFLINGITSLGNGPLHNNQGTLSELLADPNNDYKAVGRLDADKGYMGKLSLTYLFLPQFTGNITVKYRDGQPVGKWEYHLDKNNRNAVFTRNNVNGDNILLYGGAFGTREDAFWTFDLRFKYEFDIENNQLDLVWAIYNVFDFGRELLEFGFFDENPSTRNALSLQVPRGLTVAVEYHH